MIKIVDYGVGNIQAFITMFKRLGIPAERARSGAELNGATRLILPGVGAFDHAMHLLNQSGMRPQLDGMVLEKEVPVLGVCVGMQMLAGGSDEGGLPGLNWVPGRVKAFASMPQAAQLPMPHMGWNDLQVRSGAKLFSGFEPQPRFYFLHSYYFACEDKAHVVATASYGLDFDCVVSNGHIHGVQCHPEKSHHFGALLLKNFAEL
ncbi:imidazole glycerol phosphate synthase subunit HisH [Acidovorax carolinensis]|uniref:Imidazole glycerol phosphate synthase subunit HisH n=1 Tax=Acidovorax carolinensis TaxID=553814 RepID=A0A240UA94_9BURK|nr:imidazole glycerol phosphate synthase subunit HisH [Acidovorax carolinensis]ART56102.1 imidazole glycerol phosphate synthase subunit HisH [Acidovorax carolinensis]ART57972.1 imidazole glycerol phosphate synthase subunit HisH [Acidovorax carolinensis]